MKKFFTYTILLAGISLFTACQSDDDKDSPQFEEKNMLVGYWKANGNNFILFDEGKMRINFSDIYESWTYNETSKILATTAIVGKVNLQWEITLISENKWTGIGLWNATASTTVAEFGDNSFLAQIFLSNTNWVNVDNSNKKVYIEKVTSSKITFSGSASPDGRVTHTDFNSTATYDKSLDMLTILHKQGKQIKVQHPFSLDKCRMILDGYNYIENGTYKMVY